MALGPRTRVLLIAAALFGAVAALVWFLSYRYWSQPATPLRPPSQDAERLPTPAPSPTNPNATPTATPEAMPAPSPSASPTPDPPGRAASPAGGAARPRPLVWVD